MKKLIEVKRGDSVPDNANLVKLEVSQEKTYPAMGGTVTVYKDLWEIPVDKTEGSEYQQLFEPKYNSRW